jgi:hypothetical protein
LEGREILRFAFNAGWLAVFYSYAIDAELFSGEVWMGMISRKSSTLERDPKTFEFFSRFPQGLQIRVRVHPEHPTQSVGQT